MNDFSYKKIVLNGKTYLKLSGKPPKNLVKSLLQRYPDAEIIDNTDNNIINNLNINIKEKRKISEEEEKRIYDNYHKSLELSGKPPKNLVKSLLQEHPNAEIIDNTDNNITDNLNIDIKEKRKISKEEKKNNPEEDSQTLALKRFNEKEQEKEEKEKQEE
ncbi:MAG: hypothetical protein ACOCRK_05620 [bacterium]